MNTEEHKEILNDMYWKDDSEAIMNRLDDDDLNCSDYYELMEAYIAWYNRWDE